MLQAETTPRAKPASSSPTVRGGFRAPAASQGDLLATIAQVLHRLIHQAVVSPDQLLTQLLLLCRRRHLGRQLPEARLQPQGELLREGRSDDLDNRGQDVLYIARRDASHQLKDRQDEAWSHLKAMRPQKLTIPDALLVGEAPCRLRALRHQGQDRLHEGDDGLDGVLLLNEDNFQPKLQRRLQRRCFQYDHRGVPQVAIKHAIKVLHKL
mmetsp:Transcript_51996/g.149108  ORF Transcript_51996/g.149108 Transcript_51996/m.149108 type:complete len:210 (-) Transcript_51996:2759-3388(-)